MGFVGGSRSAAAFFARMGRKVSGVFRKKRPMSSLDDFASFGVKAKKKGKFGKVILGGEAVLLGTGFGFMGWEAKRIKKANRERDEAVQKFKSTLTLHPAAKTPARRKKVPRVNLLPPRQE